MSSAGQMVENRPFGVYVHWPFCAQKCPYCDFNSHVRHGGWDEARFRAAYLTELASIAQRVGPRTVTSIFFGGGTPSLMQPQTTAAILDAIASHWMLAPDAEITLEANPSSVEAGRFQGYRSAGINRVSMGFQSFNEADLARLGRIHTVAEAKAALEIARRTFARVSFDLIYARPGQQPDAWHAELHEALAHAADHISLYQLTIEPDTPYAALAAAGKLIVPDADAARVLYDITQDMTERHGLPAYEISNHARAGEESRHNLLYWRYGEYAGIGPGAHGRLDIANARIATVTEKHPETWAGLVEQCGHGIVQEDKLSAEQQADEMLLMGLRLREGIDLDRLTAVGGVRPSPDVIEQLERLGLIERASRRGFAQHNASNWRANELDPIAMCAGPGLPPEWPAIGHNAPPALLRATPEGRFVLNAIVAELSKSFEPSEARLP